MTGPGYGRNRGRQRGARDEVMLAEIDGADE